MAGMNIPTIRICECSGEAFADTAFSLQRLIRSYMFDPGKNGGHWYGSGIGRDSVVIYTIPVLGSGLNARLRFVEVWRTKTMIVIYPREDTIQEPTR